MPRRDPKTGKQPSGSANRKRRYEAVESAVSATAPPPPPENVAQDDGKWAEDFKRAGRPDLNNPETDLSYVRKLQLIVMHQSSITPFPTLAQQACWRRISEMSKNVGMTSNRAALESKVKKLEKLLTQRKQSGAVRWESGANVKKPATARGGARGPRPLPPEPADEIPPVPALVPDPKPEEPPT